MPNTYHTIIIGAGIAGATMAYTLSVQNQKVLVVDKAGIASGASGAAGAFVSPKIGKGSELQRITNEAFSFAKDFYLSACPEYFHQVGVIRIPKDESDAQKFSEYEKHNDSVYENYTREKLNALGIESKFDSFYFPQAGDCDSAKVCEHLLSNIEVVKYNVTMLKEEDGLWHAGEYRAKHIVLAMGYESNLLDMRYMGIKGTWGTRGDFASALELKNSIHQVLSVGANRDGIIKLGATHEKAVKTPILCKDKQAQSLKGKASFLIDTSDLQLKKTFCGMRAGSRDYFPLVGKVIDVEYMLKTHTVILRGVKVPLKYIDNLYVLNGLGGRGFVFAPLMAKQLSEYICENKEIDTSVNPDRLFFKWCRKLQT